MNFRTTMFLILCMLTARCHAGKFFSPLHLEKIGLRISEYELFEFRFWGSNNYKLSPHEKKLFMERLADEDVVETIISEFVDSYNVLTSHLESYPLVIVSEKPNKDHVARQFMGYVDQEYKNKFPKAYFGNNSKFMHVHIMHDGTTVISFYGT